MAGPPSAASNGVTSATGHATPKTPKPKAASSEFRLAGVSGSSLHRLGFWLRALCCGESPHPVKLQGSPTSSQADEGTSQQLRWYHVFPSEDMVYSLRRSRGPSEHLWESSEPKPMKTKPSFPASALRKVGMKEPAGFDRDAFNNDCRVCFEKPADVVLLPCKHGGLCEDCFRSTVFSRPAHRGGRQCPFCRQRIREAVHLHHESGCSLRYGYAIDVP